MVAVWRLAAEGNRCEEAKEQNIRKSHAFL